MATAVIGGIIVSTILSLIVVPSFFLIMDDLSRVLARVFSRFIGPKEAEPEEPAAHLLAEAIAESREDIEELRMRLASVENSGVTRRPSRTRLKAAE
jgi:hypothetical protein